MEYRHRFTASEWGRLEHEVTRERGLWGPEGPTPLDKWSLDAAEGPCRMRKRMCHNVAFYHHYAYNPRFKGSVVSVGGGKSSVCAFSVVGDSGGVSVALCLQPSTQGQRGECGWGKSSVCALVWSVTVVELV